MPRGCRHVRHARMPPRETRSAHLQGSCGKLPPLRPAPLFAGLLDFDCDNATGGRNAYPTERMVEHEVHRAVQSLASQTFRRFHLSREHKAHIEGELVRTILMDLREDGRNVLSRQDEDTIVRRCERYARETFPDRPPVPAQPPPQPRRAPPQRRNYYDDSDDDEMPDMSNSRPAAAAPAAGGTSGGPAAAAALAVTAPAVGSTCDARGRREDWRLALQKLLERYVPQNHGRRDLVCPFTRQGLSNLYRTDRDLYKTLQERWGLPEDPTSPHMQAGGCAPCSGKIANAFDRKTLLAHCEAKTCRSIALCPPDKRECRYEDSPDVWLHYALETHLNGHVVSASPSPLACTHAPSCVHAPAHTLPRTDPYPILAWAQATFDMDVAWRRWRGAKKPRLLRRLLAREVWRRLRRIVPLVGRFALAIKDLYAEVTCRPGTQMYRSLRRS